MSIKIEDIAAQAVKFNSSDIHIGVGRRVIFRVKSKLVPLQEVKVMEKGDVDDILRQFLTEEEMTDLYNGKELDFARSFSSEMRFRINVFLTRGTPSIVMRFLPSNIKTLDDLNLPPVLHHFTQLVQGFVVITGPTGSGKSTTLAAMINEINYNRQENIITIEDPIEFLYQPNRCIISQREVGSDSHSFTDALTACFREDVDIILLGEMRDPDTIRTAVTAAETGHLVFSTLHTNSASQSIDRIIDSFPSYQQSQVRSQLASSLQGVVAQRLVPTVDGDLVPAVEILLVNNAVRSLIREDKVYQIDTVIETHLKEGMISMNHSLFELIRSGIVSYETALMFSNDPVTLSNMLKRGGI
jgi:twitching motility protein PilT